MSPETEAERSCHQISGFEAPQCLVLRTTQNHLDYCGKSLGKQKDFFMTIV